MLMIVKALESLNKNLIISNLPRISAFSSKSISGQGKNTGIQVHEKKQAPQLSKVWSEKQIPKSLTLKGARFETVDVEKQPNPLPAIDLISKVPIIEVHENIVSCDGGGGKLGHPKIYINLDQKQAISCTYCGLRFKQI